jgi:hypothetical protein
MIRHRKRGSEGLYLDGIEPRKDFKPTELFEVPLAVISAPLNLYRRDFCQDCQGGNAEDFNALGLGLLSCGARAFLVEAGLSQPRMMSHTARTNPEQARGWHVAPCSGHPTKHDVDRPAETHQSDPARRTRYQIENLTGYRLCRRRCISEFTDFSMFWMRRLHRAKLVEFSLKMTASRRFPAAKILAHDVVKETLRRKVTIGEALAVLHYRLPSGRRCCRCAAVGPRQVARR